MIKSSVLEADCARRSQDIAQAQSNLTAITALSRSESPVQIENLETIDHANKASHYLRSFEALTYKYSENTDHDLSPAQIIEVIKAGNSFLWLGYSKTSQNTKRGVEWCY